MTPFYSPNSVGNSEKLNNQIKATQLKQIDLHILLACISHQMILKNCVFLEADTHTHGHLIDHKEGSTESRKRSF